MKSLTSIIATLIIPAALFSSSAMAAGNIAAGKAKAAMCVACHGETGISNMPPAPGVIVPHLAGQHADYLIKALEDYRSGKRQNASMSGMSAGLSDEDIENLAAFYASQSGLTEINTAKK